MADLRFLIDFQTRDDKLDGRVVTQQRRLYLALRSAVLKGDLSAGAVLPGTRALAHELGVARNSVIHAYEQLSAEGYVQSSRQGTVVVAFTSRHAKASTRLTLAGKPAASLAHARVSARTQHLERRRTPEDDVRPFMPGAPALDAFPMKRWQRLMNQVGSQTACLELGYRHAMGEPELRQAIATYLRVARGVRCHSDQIVVTDGAQHSLSLCGQILADPGDRAWIEHPGYGGARMALEQAGLEMVPITVDADGMNPPDHYWRDRQPKLIYTTPSHQYPLGSVLTLSRRMDLIDQAKRHGAWILEDDYDSEFRHDGPPLAAMQGLVDEAPVVYLGTFSKALFPGIRLGYMVLPEVLVDQVLPVVGALVRQGRIEVQRAVASFIDEGHFTTHLRRMRKLYGERQMALRDAFARRWDRAGTFVGGQCGMHLTLSLPDLADQALADAAYQHGLSPRPLSAYGTGGISGFNGLVMGYAHVPAECVDRHVRSLVQAARGLD